MPEPPRLLLAEDDPVSRSFLHAVLSTGHRVDAVADGTTALRQAREHAYALLLLDVNLPGLRGPEVLQQLRADPAAGSLRTTALALTADDDAASRITLLGLGFSAVLGKPISAHRLQQAVAEALLDAAPHDIAPQAASRPPAPHALPDWDDAAALRAANGSRTIVNALRELLRGELPAQCQRIRLAVEHDVPAEARAELHKLRAAAGFCGAPRLLAAVEWLGVAFDGGDPGPALQFLLDAATRLTLSAAPPQ